MLLLLVLVRTKNTAGIHGAPLRTVRFLHDSPVAASAAHGSYAGRVTAGVPQPGRGSRRDVKSQAPRAAGSLLHAIWQH